MKLNEYLSIKEASEILGVDIITMRNWGRRGKVKSYRNPINNYQLFKKEDIEQILKDIKNSISE